MVTDRKAFKVVSFAYFMEGQESTHDITEIVAVKSPRKYLFYVDRINAGTANAVYDPTRKSLRLSFDRGFYNGAYSPEKIREFLSEQEMTHVCPRTERVTVVETDLEKMTSDFAKMSPLFWPVKRVTRNLDKSCVDLRSQFDGREFPVLRVFPHYTSILQGAILLGFDIEKDGRKFGIITDTDIWPQRGSECFGLRGYRLKTED